MHWICVCPTISCSLICLCLTWLYVFSFRSNSNGQSTLKPFSSLFLLFLSNTCAVSSCTCSFFSPYISLLYSKPFNCIFSISTDCFFFVEMKKSVPFLLPLPSNNTPQKKIVKTTAVNGFVFNYKNAYFASSQQIDLISMLSVSYAILVYVNHIKCEWSWIFRDKCRTHKSHLSLLEFCISYFVRNCLVILGGIFSHLSVIYMFLQQTNTLTYTHIA